MLTGPDGIGHVELATEDLASGAYESCFRHQHPGSCAFQLHDQINHTAWMLNLN